MPVAQRPTPALLGSWPLNSTVFQGQVLTGTSAVERHSNVMVERLPRRSKKVSTVLEHSVRSQHHRQTYRVESGLRCRQSLGTSYSLVLIARLAKTSARARLVLIMQGVRSMILKDTRAVDAL